jgi:hypothetical protein
MQLTGALSGVHKDDGLPDARRIGEDDIFHNGVLIHWSSDLNGHKPSLWLAETTMPSRWQADLLAAHTCAAAWVHVVPWFAPDQQDAQEPSNCELRSRSNWQEQCSSS